MMSKQVQYPSRFGRMDPLISHREFLSERLGPTSHNSEEAGLLTSLPKHPSPKGSSVRNRQEDEVRGSYSCRLTNCASAAGARRD